VDSERSSELTRRLEPFAEAMSDGGGTLGEMALTLSKALQPGLDVIEAMTVLDELAAACPTPTRDGVIQHLFASGRFVGDRRDYHRWQNSCLDLVLASGRGMPITLSILAVEVARRVGVTLVGVGMPGHFLVGDPDDPDWYADPFHAATGLGRAECRALLQQLGVSRWSDRFLAPTPDRLVIARVLNNLKISCERRGDRVMLATVMQARQVLREFASERDEAAQALAVLN
jgi:regulator of sirC expression with transglutaminase-like and TPR domain